MRCATPSEERDLPGLAKILRQDVRRQKNYRAIENAKGKRERQARRISGFQSGIFCLGNAIDAGYKFLPAAKLRSEDFAALACQTIVTATALPVFFDPPSTQPSTAFKTAR